MKDGSLMFVMENHGRDFYLQSKGAAEIDYQLIDKIIRAICVDTRRSQNLYHRLISRQ